VALQNVGDEDYHQLFVDRYYNLHLYNSDFHIFHVIGDARTGASSLNAGDAKPSKQISLNTR
jgi:hypothetical protein